MPFKKRDASSMFWGVPLKVGIKLGVELRGREAPCVILVNEKKDFVAGEVVFDTLCKVPKSFRQVLVVFFENEAMMSQKGKMLELMDIN